MALDQSYSSGDSVSRANSGIDYVIAASIGVVAFFLFANPTLLNPLNMSWMVNNDPAANYIGWRYFVSTPWHFPPGLNPDFGLDLSRSIVFSDALPLFAFPFKAIGAFLPEGFHYFGLWLMVLFVLQAVAAWKLTSLFTSDRAILILSAGLFATAPALLHRLMFETTMHIALSSHFLILMAMYLMFLPQSQRKAASWLALLIGSLLIHFYIFVMVALFWWCNLRGAMSNKTLDSKAFSKELGLGAVLVLVIGWLVGYFEGGGVGSKEYGIFRANVFTFIDASGWSYVLPDLAEGPGDYEGFSYLGLGVILAGILSIALLMAKKTVLPGATFWQAFPFIALAAFAITFDIGIGDKTLSIPYPSFIDSLAGILRASGRMMWPAYYLIIIGVIFVIVTALPRRTAATVLAVALAIQIADTSTFWASERNPLKVTADRTWFTKLNDPRWDELGTNYDRLIVTRPRNAAPGWRDLSALGLEHGMATNAIYISRMTADEATEARENIKDAIITNGFDTRTLYIIHEEDLGFVQTQLDNKADALLQIDGHHILAPGWLNK